MQLLLASKSPRRRELLAQLGIPFTIVNIDVDEKLTTPVSASRVAESLSLLKAQGYDRPIKDDEVLVTADTVVVLNDLVLGKPHSRTDAIAMIKSLSGNSHQVYTGVTLRSPSGTKSFTECTQVRFRELSESEIVYYVDTYKPFDKAGAYGIQEWIGMVGIESIEGCYYNVMGLPVARLYKELKSFVNRDDLLVH